MRNLNAYLERECNVKVSTDAAKTALRKLGYKWKKARGEVKYMSKKSIDKERKFMVEYAEALRLEEEGKAIIMYTDESYVNQHHHSDWGWYQEEEDDKHRSSKGVRMIITHCITKHGPVVTRDADTGYPIEEGALEVDDYSHLGMASRFLAGSLGLPFMPIKSLLGTDILNKKSADGRKPFELVDNPWNPGEPVVLLPACNPDVSIIHAQKADEMGNVIIEGFTTQEPEMVKASKAVIVSCEEVVSTDEVRRDPDRTTIPYIFVDAVVEQPWGAYPTSTYRYYEHDEEQVRSYQDLARAGGEPYAEYIQRSILDCKDFDEYLRKTTNNTRLDQLRASMLRLL